MKHEILKLISENPRHYATLIKKKSKMTQWVDENCLIKEDYLPARIYSAIHQESNVCEYGNIKKFTRFGTGFVGCGPAKTCKCTSDSISRNVSKTKQLYTDQEKTATNNKRKSTMILKYGTEYNSQRDDVKLILSKPKIELSIHEKLIDREWLDREYNLKQRNLSEIADELGVYYGTVGFYCRKFGFNIRPVTIRSTEETQICNFIRELGLNLIESDRTIIPPKELDIVIPDKKIAIEVNGLFWHSHHPSIGKPENRTQHISKSNLAKNAGVALIHITDYEWNNKQPIIKSLISSKLGLNSKISARKCTIGYVTKDLEREFLNDYHLQGYVSSNISLGLYYQENLVMILSLGKSRFKKEYDYELLRLCSKSGITVVGGLSKLISKIKKLLPGTSIISYCDLDKGTGIGYQIAGFKLIETTGPGYFWTTGTKIFSRYRCQKKQLAKWLPNFDPKLSETVNLFNAGYKRYWNCGNAVYILNTPTK